MSFLQILWFILIGVLFAGFFFLDGFDFGVGMATRSLAHNEDERSQIIETIGPVWDGFEINKEVTETFGETLCWIVNRP